MTVYTLAHRAKQKTYRVWSLSRMHADWEAYWLARRSAQLIHENAKRAFTKNGTNLYWLMHLIYGSRGLPWSLRSLMRATFGGQVSQPSLVSRWGHLDAKKCRDHFQQPHSCNPSPVQCSVAFRSSFVRSLLLNVDPYGRNDPDGMFPLFYKHVARELALGCNF